MTDKELLKLAAKAAGVEVVTPTMLEYGKWNPLEDDGDALRLAVTLEMCIDFKDGNYKRSIVRAAAEIGKAMLWSALFVGGN